MEQAIERAIAALVDLSKRYPPEAAPRIEPPASRKEISELQLAAGAVVPGCVLTLLRRTRAIIAMDIRNGYWIGGPSKLSRSMRRHDYPTGFDVHGEFAPAIPIATDGGGNAFMLSLTAGSVWRWNHETGAVTCISEDLLEFLRRVAKDWEHDLNGDDAWIYLV